jgi:hypothetical protein
VAVGCMVWRRGGMCVGGTIALQDQSVKFIVIDIPFLIKERIFLCCA